MDASSDMRPFTVEGIAERVGINKNILYEWVKSDSEFTTALERLDDAQKNDLFKTGTKEDTFVNAMVVALLLMETRDRHYKPHDQ
jgi:transposase-like protein